MTGAVARPIAWMTATCGALALLVGAPSIWFPFGRDQGLFYYAAREWLLRGQVLYRDVWDHKPPIIYFIYMTAIGFLGEHEWSIRVLELLVAVPALGWCTARLSQEMGERARADLFAVAWLGVAVCYYAYFTFWDQAQCEIWSVLFVALASVSALHARRAAVGAASGGALSAMALFTKPPIVFFVVLCACAVIFRARHDGGGVRVVAVRLLQWTLGVAAVAALLLGYFAARGALADMIDIVVGANAVYVADERTFESVHDMWGATTLRFATMEPFSAAVVVVVSGALLAGLVRRDWNLMRRYALPLFLSLATFGGVVVQLKFYQYHWGTIAAAAGVFAATVYRDVLRIGAIKGSRWLAPALYLAAVASLWTLSGAPVRGWLANAELTRAFVTGDVSHAAFQRAFDIPGFYSNYDADLTGRWLAAHARDGDTLAVRGFEPEIYATSGLHYTGRFFWTAFLTMPSRKYRRAELLREDRRALMRDMPRFVVALTGLSRGIDSPGWFEHRGYFRRVQIGAFTVLERARL